MIPEWVDLPTGVAAFIFIGLYMTALRLVSVAQHWAPISHLLPSKAAGMIAPRRHASRWLFCGPRPTRRQSLHQMLSHYPAYIAYSVKLYTFCLPVFIGNLIRSSLRAGKLQYSDRVTDQQIFDLVISGPLLVMADIDGNYLGFSVPEMYKRGRKGIDPSNLRIAFDISTQTITMAKWGDVNIIGDNSTILSVVVIALTLWAHPKTHISAEQSARDILDKGVNELTPSGRFVVALHDGLLHGRLSPLASRHPLSMNVDREDAKRAAMTIPLPHKITRAKEQFRYYHFLLAARKSVHILIRHYGLGVNAEHLFANMIVHSVDHHLSYQHLSKMPAWSLDGGRSLMSYWRSQVFVQMWTRSVATPLVKEKISQLATDEHPFYRDLYNDLCQHDKELADCILASTSF